MPFDDNKASPAKKGLKINNSGSMFANQPKKADLKSLEQSAKDAGQRNRVYKERAADLALKFRKMLDDRTIQDNKPMFANELEREVLNELAQLGIDMNLDDQEEEGMGSVGLIALLFRCLLIQRDKINVLDFNLNLLDRRLKKLESKEVDTPKKSE